MSRLLIFNKPYNVLCQFSSHHEHTTLTHFIHDPQYRNFYPAGRLDRDSEGLLVLTNDGALQHRITHPSNKMPKRYWVQIEGKPTPSVLDQFREGIELNDGPTLPAPAQIIAEPELWPRSPPIRYRKKQSTSWLEVTLSEGRNRQVRRMTAAVGHPTLRLVRVAIGPWVLGGLAPGELRCEQVHLPSTIKSTKTQRRPQPDRRNK